MVVINVGGCCCPTGSGSGSGSGSGGTGSYICSDGFLIPANFTITVSGYVPCITDSGCQGNIVLQAPLEDGAYSLSRHYTTTGGECGNLDNCAACYSEGDLTVCDIAAIHGTTIAANCGGDSICEVGQCNFNQQFRHFKYVKTTVCDDVTIDSYISVTCCVAFGVGGAVANVSIHYVHVLANGPDVTMWWSRGVWSTGSLFLNLSCTAFSGIGCAPDGSNNNSGSGNLTLGPAPGYSGSMNNLCCGDFTISVNAG